MELHQLLYFVAVAETGGFSRAAERCHVAQPSLSQQVQKLEHELGQPLFDRLGRGVTLTEAGRALLPRARVILAEVQQIKRSLRQEIQDGYGQLAVGVIPTVAPYLLPGIIRRFSELYPKAELSVYEDVTAALVTGLIEGRLDLGIMSLPIHNKLIETVELLTEPLVLASPRYHQVGHHSFVSKAWIDAKEIEGFPFIALNEIHCLGEQIQSFCYTQELALEIVCHTAQLATVHSCVAAGLGVSLVPLMMAAQDHSEKVLYRPVRAEMPKRKIVAATHRDRTQSHLTRRFVCLVQAEYQTLQGNWDYANFTPFLQ